MTRWIKATNNSCFAVFCDSIYTRLQLVNHPPIPVDRVNAPECTYKRWLNLDNTCPDYFELLGIEHQETDSERIKSAAKQALKTLGARPNTAIQYRQWKLLRRQVKLAFRCLADDNSRTSYLSDLITEARKSDDSRNRADLQPHSEDESSGKLKGEIQLDDIPVAIPVAEIICESSTDGPNTIVNADTFVETKTKATKESTKLNLNTNPTSLAKSRQLARRPKTNFVVAFSLLLCLALAAIWFALTNLT